MTEDESDLSPSGAEDLQDDDYGDNEYDATENDEEGQTGQDEVIGQEGQELQDQNRQAQVQEVVSAATFRELGPVASPEEINELAAELGFTTAQFTKAAKFFGRIASHNVAAAGISNAHLQEELITSPGLRVHTPAIQRNLTGLSLEAQTQPRYVKGAIAMSFVEQSKDGESFPDIVKKMAKACGLRLADNAPQSQQGTRTGPAPRIAASPAPTTGGTRNPVTQAPARAKTIGAAAFLANRNGLSEYDAEVMRDEITGRRKAI